MTIQGTEMGFFEPLPPELEAMQAVAAARRDARHVPADWRRQLGAIARKLRGLSGLAPVRLPERGISLSGQHGFKLEPAGAVAGNDPHRKFFVHLEDCADFVVDGLALRRGRNAVFLHRCRRFRVANLDLSDLEGYGVILFDCSEFVVEGVRSRGLLCSAVTAIGDTRMGAIRRVRARGGRGFLNCDAGGVVLLHCTDRVGPEDVPERCQEARSILEKTKRPRCIDMAGIDARGCRAQGIYLAGALACRVSRSVLARSNKEGICFDWGTALCELTLSVVSGNGRRASPSAEEIRADFIGRFPTLPDGSSAAKLPGVSMDNAAFNTVSRCLLVGNHGGAAKFVRACVGNRVEMNAGWSNSAGDNAHMRFPRYADAGAFDPLGEFGGSALCDLGPSRGNAIRRNLVAPAPSAVIGAIRARLA
jgi:hypothetical protein